MAPIITTRNVLALEHSWKISPSEQARVDARWRRLSLAIPVDINSVAVVFPVHSKYLSSHNFTHSNCVIMGALLSPVELNVECK